ncbi:MAG: hypothetical protein K2J40_09345 [Ruminococcus sp.]|nr:hypothetical protein [Ruminococcus sp.]
MKDKSQIYLSEKLTDKNPEVLRKYSPSSVKKRFQAEKKEYIKQCTETYNRILAQKRNSRKVPIPQNHNPQLNAPQRKRRSKAPLILFLLLTTGALGGFGYNYFFDEDIPTTINSLLTAKSNNPPLTTEALQTIKKTTASTTTINTTTTSTSTTSTATTSTSTTSTSTTNTSTTSTSTTSTVTTTIAYTSEKPSVYAVNNMYGQLIIKSESISGYTTDYVVNDGKYDTVRNNLRNSWHVTAKNTVTSYGVTWYELWDSDDGDYYGWVDENYIYFYPSEPAEVTPVNMQGHINCHGVSIAGFPTEYVVNFKRFSKSNLVRQELGNNWHIVAKNKCSSYKVTWYELWDADDGDYYGWVDEYYIDFN